jgi:hypothetical protein
VFILLAQFSVIAQSDLASHGSWVGDYEAAERVILFFIEWDEEGNSHFHTNQSPHTSQIRDLHQEPQQIQFTAGTGENKLFFHGAGMRMRMWVLQTVRPETGVIIWLPSKKLPPSHLIHI